jgi:8-oxo-dGTP pyrophosphatase MutT (NUDIX family)
MRETVRAIIMGKDKKIFLVQHREMNPSDMGKWGTPGGCIEKSDIDQNQTLLRELSEEFGNDVINQIKIGPKLRVNHRADRVDHFYLVVFSGSQMPPKSTNEIMNSGWFNLEEASALELYFGFEVQLAKESISLLI